MTYTLVYLGEPIECHDCGEDTDAVYVADAIEDATGYRDSISLCVACYEKRESAA